MSVHLNIYTTSSEKTALDKELSNQVSLTGNLRNESNVINPSIEIEASAETIATKNYFEVTEFGRKYFITEITALGYDRCVITGHVDVLSTYKNQIRTNEAVIARSETRYNLFIDDGLFKADSRTIIQTKKFSDGGAFTIHPHIALVVVS